MIFLVCLLEYADCIPAEAFDPHHLKECPRYDTKLYLIGSNSGECGVLLHSLTQSSSVC